MNPTLLLAIPMLPLIAALLAGLAGQLIGFWYTRPTAIFASLKAFLVNRVGDFGFVLGIAGVLYYTGSLDYRDAFAVAPAIAGKTMILFQGHPWSALTAVSY